MEQHNDGSKYSGYFSKKVRAGKRRTYFFDVRSTRSGDFFLTLTESKKRNEGDGYESHKIFLYKEDFKKFLDGLNEAVNYIKTELMPDYDFDAEYTPPARTDNSDGTDHLESSYKSTEASYDLPSHDEPTETETPTVEKPASNNETSAPTKDEDLSWN